MCIVEIMFLCIKEIKEEETGKLDLDLVFFFFLPFIASRTMMFYDVLRFMASLEMHLRVYMFYVGD